MSDTSHAGIAEIKGYHAHVYYDADTKPLAATLREAIERHFEITMGRWHDRPVGPHPMWSYQVAFEPELFGSLVPWLNLNRTGLTVFVHPETGDALRDHADRAMWLGETQILKLEMFKNRDKA